MKRRLERVLIVEDDVALRSGIARMVRSWGARPLEAGTAHQAKQLLSASPDLIIIDVALPDARADEILEAARALSPTPVKVANLDHSPFVSVSYWDAQQDVATAECRATWHHDDDTCAEAWDRFANTPEPLGYDPAMIPPWKDGPTSPAFSVLRLDPWRLRVFPGSLLLTGEGEPRDWHE